MFGQAARDAPRRRLQFNRARRTAASLPGRLRSIEPSTPSPMDDAERTCAPAAAVAFGPGRPERVDESGCHRVERRDANVASGEPSVCRLPLWTFAVGVIPAASDPRRRRARRVAPRLRGPLTAGRAARVRYRRQVARQPIGCGEGRRVERSAGRIAHRQARRVKSARPASAGSTDRSCRRYLCVADFGEQLDDRGDLARRAREHADALDRRHGCRRWQRYRTADTLCHPRASERKRRRASGCDSPDCRSCRSPYVDFGRKRRAACRSPVPLGPRTRSG